MPELGFTDLFLGFLLLITPVVYFHELGHYWVARKAGVVVDVFSNKAGFNGLLLSVGGGELCTNSSFSFSIL